MRVLLDTHILLWSLLEPSRLQDLHREVLEAPEFEIFFSAANIWEIAIKRALNRSDFDAEPEVIRAAAWTTGFQELPISGAHAAAVRQLPDHHRDPFDRILIGQAKTEPMRLMSTDPLIKCYAVECL
jgi:PIN domain nuclease of toxin-antitoxin system